MDKLRLTNHIKDVDLKQKIFRIIDKAEFSLKNYCLVNTEFLNPYEVKVAKDILNSEMNLKYTIFGGYESSERKVIYIYPDFFEFEQFDEELYYIQIDGNFKFRNISHRECLGSILSLGIKREKIGDILIHEDFCQVIVDYKMGDYIVFNLQKISKNKVILKKIKKEDISVVKTEYIDKNIIVSANRVDSVISKVYNLSRQESQKLITNDKIAINYRKISSSSEKVSDSDLISVRGRGRFVVSILENQTKKGKIRMKINIIK